jgi:DNA polymerase-3 subunit alpha
VGVISSITKKKDKNKNTFAFVNVYSTYGIIEAVVWSRQYRDYEEMLRKGTQVVIAGRKTSEINITVDRIKSYQQWLIDRKIKKGGERNRTSV